jgi:hypothetical protein
MQMYAVSGAVSMVANINRSIALASTHLPGLPQENRWSHVTGIFRSGKWKAVIGVSLESRWVYAVRYSVSTA